MKKQFVKSSNTAPSLYLGTVLILAMAIRVFGLPAWTWGVWGTLSVLIVMVGVIRMFTEEGIDVVKR